MSSIGFCAQPVRIAASGAAKLPIEVAQLIEDSVTEANSLPSLRSWSIMAMKLRELRWIRSIFKTSSVSHAARSASGRKSGRSRSHAAASDW